MSYMNVPVGAVLPFASTTIPFGYLDCNGAAVSRTTYAKLFAVIGTAHGTGDGSTTFNIPDYRGYFLRGQAQSSANDPGRASRTAMATGGATGDNVGSVQADAFQGHAHSGRGYNNSFAAGSLYQTVVYSSGTPGITVTGGPVSDGSSGTPRTSTETRPLNAYVRFIIKY